MGEAIRVEVDFGRWEVLGVDRNPGIYPESIGPTYDRHGPEGLTFTLRRDPNVDQPDLAEFTPVDYLVDGRLVWSGFITDAPSSDDSISVTARGWQFYTDDDSFRALYAHEDLSAWGDARSRPGADLTVNTSGWLVDAGANGISLSYPGPHRAAGGWTRGGVLIDVGADNLAIAAAIDWEKIGGTWAGVSTLYCKGASTLAEALVGLDAATITTLSSGGGTTGTVAGLFPGRFIYIFADANTVQDAARAVRITGLRLFGASAYNAGGQSVVTASMVLGELTARYPLLDLSTADIDATTLALRHFVVADESGRAVIERANAYHAWRWKIDENRRLSFRAQPASPTLAVDLSRRGARWQDASTRNAGELYNRVTVIGRSGAGDELKIERSPTFTDVLTRRGRIRRYTLTIDAPTDLVAMAALGDAFLNTHARSTLKGTLVIESDDAVRTIAGAAPVPASDLGRYTTELILLQNLVDPLDGSLGRNGAIVGVSVADGIATLTIDNERGSFQALLARMGGTGRAG